MFPPWKMGGEEMFTMSLGTSDITGLMLERLPSHSGDLRSDLTADSFGLTTLLEPSVYISLPSAFTVLIPALSCEMPDMGDPVTDQEIA